MRVFFASFGGAVYRSRPGQEKLAEDTALLPHCWAGVRDRSNAVEAVLCVDGIVTYCWYCIHVAVGVNVDAVGDLVAD